MKIQDLSIKERIELVEDIWDSIVAEQESIPLTEAQKKELDQRLSEYRINKDPGEPANEVIDRIRAKL